MVLENRYRLEVFEKSDKEQKYEAKIIYNYIVDYMSAKDMATAFEERGMYCSIYMVNETEKEKTYTLMYKSKLRG